MPPLGHQQEDYVTKIREATRSLLTLIDDICSDPPPFRLDRLLRKLSVTLSDNVVSKPVEVP
jgi:hypothetical protein